MVGTDVTENYEADMLPILDVKVCIGNDRENERKIHTIWKISVVRKFYKKSQHLEKEWIRIC